MRCIVFSDLHLNLWRYGARIVDGRNTRLVDQQNVLSQMTAYAKTNGIKHVFFCGDFFHTHGRVETEVLRAGYESLESLRSVVDLVFVVGNHDQATKSGDIHSMDLLRQYGPVVDTQMSFHIDGLDVHAHPYTEDEASLIRFFKNCSPYSVALVHQGVHDVPLNSKGFTLNELLRPAMVPPSVTCFAGHYHDPLKVSDNLIIPGAPLQFNWSDKGGRRGWLDVTLGEGEIKMLHVESVAPQFVEVQADVLGEKDCNVGGNFVRVIASLAQPAEEIRKRATDMGALSVEVVTPTDPETTKVDDAGFDTVDKLFDEYVKTKSLDEDTVKIGREIMDGSYVASIE